VVTSTLPCFNRWALVVTSPFTKHNCDNGWTVTWPSMLSRMQCSASIPGPYRTKTITTITFIAGKVTTLDEVKMKPHVFFSSIAGVFRWVSYLCPVSLLHHLSQHMFCHPETIMRRHCSEFARSTSIIHNLIILPLNGTWWFQCWEYHRQYRPNVATLTPFSLQLLHNEIPKRVPTNL
jgi:hypothetical protein